MHLKSFEETYLEIAKLIAKNRSQDKWTKVGCVAVNINNECIAVAYNGYKSGYKPPFDDSLEYNRELKNKLMLHAEWNLLSRINKGDVYKVFLTVSPCSVCARLLSIYGVKEVYYLDEYHREDDFKYIFDEYGVKYERLDISNK